MVEDATCEISVRPRHPFVIYKIRIENQEAVLASAQQILVS